MAYSDGNLRKASDYKVNSDDKSTRNSMQSIQSTFMNVDALFTGNTVAAFGTNELRLTEGEDSTLMSQVESLMQISLPMAGSESKPNLICYNFITRQLETCS